MAQIDTTAVINAIRLAQQGSNPASPAATYWVLFIKSDGLYIKDSAGNVMGPIRGMANSTLWDAAGDLAYGTGADTGTRLGIGTANQVLRVNAGATAPEWGYSGIYPTMTPPVSSAFSWTNQLSTTVTDYANRQNYSMPTNATDPNWRLWVASAALPAHHQIDAAFTVFCDSSINYSDIGIGLRNSSSGKFISFAIDQYQAGFPRIRNIRFDSVTAVSSIVAAANVYPPSALLFFRIVDAGTNRLFSYSVNGYDYFQFGSEATGTFITPDQAMIVMSNKSGVTLNMYSCFHWAITSI